MLRLLDTLLDTVLGEWSDELPDNSGQKAVAAVTQPYRI